MADIKWGTPSTHTLVIRGDGTAPTLKNLSAGGRKLGSEIDNATDKHLYADLTFKVRGASAFAATDYVTFYLIHALDASTYEDGDDSTTPAKPPHVVFPVRAVSTQQRIELSNIPIPPFKYKWLCVNSAGVAFTNTDDENQLFERRHSENVA